MKNDFNTIRYIKKIFLFFSLIVLMFLSCEHFFIYSAYEQTNTALSKDEIHDITLANNVSQLSPEITFLVHGYEGSAIDWSNNLSSKTKYEMTSFSYDENSIIEKIRNSTIEQVDLYRVKLVGLSTLRIYCEYSYDESNTISYLSDFSSHTIVVVEVQTDNPMEEMYNDLETIVDRVLYDFYVDKSYVPLINLVGHSLGGLLNIQYAIEHPKNVESLISLGTPYNGSWYDNWFVENILDFSDFSDQACITGRCNHSYYFCDIEDRKNAWNNVYEENNHIRFCALSAETSIDLLNEITVNNYIAHYYGDDKQALANAIFGNVIAQNYVGSILPGDICVDGNSQRAEGYDGVIRYKKLFTCNNSDLNKKSRDAVPIPHNLETYDIDMQNCILNILKIGNRNYGNEYNEYGITAKIITCIDDHWLIQITNDTEFDCSFEYSEIMCSEALARSWDGIGNVKTTGLLKVGGSALIDICKDYYDSTFTISYERNGVRYVFCADNLNAETLTMSSYGVTLQSYSYNCYNININIISKNYFTWVIKLTNNTETTQSLYYNDKMCFESDAINWGELNNICKTKFLSPGDSEIIEITESGTATHITLSFIRENDRFIIYGNNLQTFGAFTCGGNVINYNTYTQNDINVGIIGKCTNKWLLEVRNCSEQDRSFEYNKKMCFENDAKTWNGLSDIADTYILKKGQSILIEIEENGTAGCIALSYTYNNMRYIFYARNLNYSSSMTSYESTTAINKYNKNGIEVGILRKNGNTWLLELTNCTGTEIKLEYNTKMCFESDACNWKNLTNIEEFTMYSDTSLTRQIEIQENGTAACIAISYVLSNYRYVFYARNLSSSGTMTAMSNVIDLSDSGGECITEGTLITLYDGSVIPVEQLTGNEALLVWNFETGEFDRAPILFIDSECQSEYKIIELKFSDDTIVEIVYEHGFWNLSLNKYVYLNENAHEYIGHNFAKRNGDVLESVRLIDVQIKVEETTVYSPVTVGHLCYFVNDMLSMPGGIEGLFNYFEVDNMKYDEDLMRTDIESFGLFTYDELNSVLPMDVIVFESINGQYLKVAIGKHLITIERMRYLLIRYEDKIYNNLYLC